MRAYFNFALLGLSLSASSTLASDGGQTLMPAPEMIRPGLSSPVTPTELPAPPGSVLLQDPVTGSGRWPSGQMFPGQATAEPAYAGEGAPNCLECSDCCPEWLNYGELDLLAMSRTNGLADQPLVLDANDPTNVLMRTGDFSFGVAPGVRALLGHRGENDWGAEVGYTGIYTAFADSEFSNTDNLSAPGDLAGALDGWTTADYIDPVYKSTLNLFEANLFWSKCERKCKPESWFPWNRHDHCSCTDLLAGFVWAGLDETADYNVICCVGDPVSAYSIDTSSSLLGLQLGIRKRADWERWSLQGTLKGAAAASFLQSDASSIYSTLAQSGNPGDALVTVRDPIHLSENDVAGILQFNLSLIYRVNPQLGIRAGYNAIGLFNVALAPDQWDFTDTADSGTRLNGGGDVLFHGANLGIEYRW